MGEAETTDPTTEKPTAMKKEEYNREWKQNNWRLRVSWGLSLKGLIKFLMDLGYKKSQIISLLPKTGSLCLMVSQLIVQRF